MENVNTREYMKVNFPCFRLYLNLNAVATNIVLGWLGHITEIKLLVIIAKKTIEREFSFSSDILVAVAISPYC